MYAGTCHILVVGSGIAGLSFALHCARHFPHKKIVVLSKTAMAESNTRYAQGGIAAVTDLGFDSYEEHVNDTLRAGDGLCKPLIVDLVVRQAPEAIRQLEDWGVSFDQHKKGHALAREGGHGKARVLHCHDHTGASISEQLLARCLQQPNIELREHHFALELLKGSGPGGQYCQGVLARCQEEVYTLHAGVTMLASGGAGQLYELSSNPPLATADGIGMARAAGVKLENMAFVQFHPTVLYEPGSDKRFLISEAVRGFGALLRNHEGEEFMYRYDPRGSLATRDIVSRAIFLEMQKAKQPHLWLDLRHLDPQQFAAKFPTIFQYLEERNFSIGEDLIPVVPAAHYLCGGIATNRWAETSLPGLLACGETACTGLHGANRLASNSLLEAMVFAQHAFWGLEDKIAQPGLWKIPKWEEAPATTPYSVQQRRRELQRLMSEKVGIVRNQQGLNSALKQLKQWIDELPAIDHSVAGTELRNLLWAALAVTENSLEQKQNCGGFYNSDLEKSGFISRLSLSV